jgi:hypothetical protein
VESLLSKVNTATLCLPFVEYHPYMTILTKKSFHVAGPAETRAVVINRRAVFFP